MRKQISVLALLVGMHIAALGHTHTDILVVGGGASGTAAALQVARMGMEVLVVEETPWLGGMLTAAGVSAIDGNHRLPSGLWGEFRRKLYDYYGGPQAVGTGWVSNTLFEPAVGNRILKELVADEAHITVWYRARWNGIRRSGNRWLVDVHREGKTETVEAKLVIDATELGDVMAAAGAQYRVGMDSRYETGESYAPEAANDIIQDMTYVATLKDFGRGTDQTIPKPEGYDPSEFRKCCDVTDPAPVDSDENDCAMMLRYGRLPHGKYMINWPKSGNDIYLNLIEKTPEERAEALKEAKLHTLRFIYYIQMELGYKHLGLATDEYPTDDGLPLIPYHRESRRVKGKATLTLNHVRDPYQQPEAYYRTGIAVGDYPIDHHHFKNSDAPEIDFINIRVPSYNIPLGSLIPEGVPGLIVAEKSISVTNVVNGATRLQPVVMGIGQAAGALAAVCLQERVDPESVSIRSVQKALLDAGAYLMPFIDVQPDDPDFAAIQRVGATGVLNGFGVPYQWANQTWFYPERPISAYELLEGLRPYHRELANYWAASGDPLTVVFLAEVCKEVGRPITLEEIQMAWRTTGHAVPIAPDKALTRRQAAVLVDALLADFDRPIDFNGQLETE